MADFRTYEYRILPTKEQHVALDTLFQKADDVFNELAKYANMQAVLNDKEEAKANINGFAKTLKGVNPSTLSKILKYIMDLVDKLFTLEINDIYPCNANRARRNYYYSSAEICDTNIILPGVGAVAMEQHRKLPAGANVCTVGVHSENYGALYCVSLLVQMPPQAVMQAPIRYNKVIGLDYAQNGLYIDSNGDCGDYPGFRRMAQVQLGRYRKAAQRFKPGSIRWKKYQQRAAKLEQHIKNQRKDWQYKKAHELAEQYDAVCVETLSLKDNSVQLLTFWTNTKPTKSNSGGLLHCLQSKYIHRFFWHSLC